MDWWIIAIIAGYGFGPFVALYLMARVIGHINRR